MRPTLRIIIQLLGLIAWSATAHAQLETIPTPLWEGVEKSASDIENDKNLVKLALEASGGDRTKAATAMVQSGWQQIIQGKPHEAVRRFNQAWLVKPDLGDIYWGLAVATHIRGDDLKMVERWFDEAGKTFGDSPRFLSDRGRVLEERKLPESARKWFEAAIEAEPRYLPAHVGMVLVARALNDKELEEKHQKQHDELIEKAE